MTNIPNGFEVDFYNGLIYPKKSFEEFILKNKIVLIPEDFVKTQKPKIEEEYKDRKIGDFYSFTLFVEVELSKMYSKLYNVPFSKKCRTRQSVKFGYSVRWNENKTEFYF